VKKIFHRYDKDAEFEAFYQKELIPLINFIRKSGFDDESAKDIASDCFCDLYQRWHNAVDKRTLLYDSVKASLTKTVRQKNLEKKHENKYLAVVLMDGVASPLITNEGFTNLVNGVLNGLDEELRPYFYHYASGKSQQEVAELIGVSQKTVSIQLEKAYNFAKRYLDVHGLSEIN
jgi:RNA polymerase sigma factor (sigma-70 family)